MTLPEAAIPARTEVATPGVTGVDQARAAVLARRIGLVAVCLLAAILGGRHLTDESYVSLQGDMPRYLMNGVYFLDVLRDHPFGSMDAFIEYTQLYFARYPALSLGHHPPLLSAALVPAFGIFGVSVVTGKVVVLLSFVGAVALLYLLVRDMYGHLPALLSATFLATSQLVLELGQSVLAEVPSITLLLAAAYALRRFGVTGARPALVGFVIAAALSVYAKQLSIFVFPAYFVLALMTLGWRRMLRRDVMWATAVLIVLVIPMALISVFLSPSNVTIAAQSSSRGFAGTGAFLERALATQLELPVVGLACLGLLIAAFRRDRYAMVFAVWMSSVFLGMLLTGRHDPPRFSVNWVPAFAAMAGAVAAGWRQAWLGRTAAALVFLVAVFQIEAAARVGLPGAQGYEEAARFVLASNPGPTVLFSGDIDTGFFSLFVRKHDVHRQLVVLRADKMLTTSFLARPDLKDRIADRAEIYPLLQRFGTRYVVIEDRKSRAPVLEWLREELRSAHFAERARIPMRTTDVRLAGTSLVIYEFLDATPPDSAAVLSMSLPLAHRSLEVKLSDLIARKYLR